jgi:hypothetical protein
VQIFLLSSFFCSKLTRYFTSEFFLKSLEKFLIAGVLLKEVPYAMYGPHLQR